MSTGIEYAARPPSTATASDMTVTAIGFRSEARIRPFMGRASPIAGTEARTTQKLGMITSRRSAGSLDCDRHAWLERGRRAKHHVVVGSQSRIDLDQGAVVGP